MRSKPSVIKTNIGSGVGGMSDMVLISQIAPETPYSSEYLGFLVRNRKIFGRMFGKNWHVSRKSLAEYLRTHRVLVTAERAERNVMPVIGQTADLMIGTRANQGDALTQAAPKDDKLSAETKRELDKLEEIYREKVQGTGRRLFSTRKRRAGKEEKPYEFSDFEVNIQSSNAEKLPSWVRVINAGPHGGGFEEGEGFTIWQWLGVVVISFLVLWLALKGF